MKRQGNRGDWATQIGGATDPTCVSPSVLSNAAASGDQARVSIRTAARFCGAIAARDRKWSRMASRSASGKASRTAAKSASEGEFVADFWGYCWRSQSVDCK